MLPVSQTARQRMIELLSGTRLSAYQLAQMLGISERQVEEHLAHVVKTIARDRRQAFHSGTLHLSGMPFYFSRPHETDQTKPLPPLPKREHHRPPLWHRGILLMGHCCGFSAFAMGDHPSSTRVSL